MEGAVLMVFRMYALLKYTKLPKIDVIGTFN